MAVLHPERERPQFATLRECSSCAGAAQFEMAGEMIGRRFPDDSSMLSPDFRAEMYGMLQSRFEQGLRGMPDSNDQLQPGWSPEDIDLADEFREFLGEEARSFLQRGRDVLEKLKTTYFVELDDTDQEFVCSELQPVLVRLGQNIIASVSGQSWSSRMKNDTWVGHERTTFQHDAEPGTRRDSE